MVMVHEERTSDLSCATCGRVLLREDEERKWAKCGFCEKPVCFNCIRYVGTSIRGSYMDYVAAIRTCDKCYVARG